MERNIDYAMILLKEMVLKLNNNLSKFINLAYKFKKIIQIRMYMISSIKMIFIKIYQNMKEDS